MGRLWARGADARTREERPAADDDDGRLGPEHAWWAEREALSGIGFARSAPGRPQPVAEPAPEAWSYWTSWWRRDPLFEHEQRAEQRAQADADEPVAMTLGLEAALAVLGLRPGASRADVVLARRRLAKRWHPDVAPDGPERDEHDEKMRRINAAYDELQLLLDDA